MGLTNISRDVLQKGKLEERGLCELLGIAFSLKVSGTLKTVTGRRATEIVLFQGLPVFARTTGASRHLLDVIATERGLTPEDVLQVKQFSAEKGIGVEEALKILFDVTESQFYYFRAEIIKEIIAHACGAREGEYSFTPFDEPPADLEMYDLNPLELIHQGISHFRPPRLFEEMHRLEKRRVRLNPDLHDFVLLPGPLYAKSHVLDVFSHGVELGWAADVLSHEFKDIGLAMEAIYLFLVAGLIVFLDPPPQAAVEGAEAAAEPEVAVSWHPHAPEERDEYIIVHKRKHKKKAPVPSPPEGERAPAKGTAERIEEPPRKPAPAAPAPDMKKEEIERAVKVIANLEEKMEMAVSLYDLLGVAVETDAADIQEIYVECDRPLEPENLPRDLPAEVMEQAARLRNRLKETMQTLTDPERRSEFERKQSEEEIKRSWNADMKAPLAKKNEARGKWYLRHNSPALAREFFEKALDLDAGLTESYMLLGWALFRSRPEEAAEAEAEAYLRQALDLEPGLGKAHYYLGLIAKHNGDEDEAERRMRSAVELDPQNHSARRELSFLAQRKKETGLWEKIFGGK